MSPTHWVKTSIYVKLYKLKLCLLGAWTVGILASGAVKSGSIKTALYLLISENVKVAIHLLVACCVLRTLLTALHIAFCLIILIIL